MGVTVDPKIMVIQNDLSEGHGLCNLHPIDILQDELKVLIQWPSTFHGTCGNDITSEVGVLLAYRCLNGGTYGYYCKEHSNCQCDL